MSVPLITLILTIIGWIVMAFKEVFWGGVTIGRYKRDLEVLKKENEDLCKAISINNDSHNARYRSLEELVFKVKDAVVSHTGKTINGISYRGTDGG